MKIAVSKYRNRLLVTECKAYSRLTADSKALALTATICLEINPSNMMLVKHRMLN